MRCCRFAVTENYRGESVKFSQGCTGSGSAHRLIAAFLSLHTRGGNGKLVGMLTCRQLSISV